MLHLSGEKTHLEKSNRDLDVIFWDYFITLRRTNRCVLSKQCGHQISVVAAKGNLQMQSSIDFPQGPPFPRRQVLFHPRADPLLASDMLLGILVEITRHVLGPPTPVGHSVRTKEHEGWTRGWTS